MNFLTIAVFPSPLMSLESKNEQALASESEVRVFDPGRGRWIFSERKNPEYDFLRKESKAVGPLS